uniref:uncharacterized protein LOC120335855 n=1 Tax=Styela clava TaxID=7725 RepID=UPI001939E130|nr:uncharacterized protein LOC120335855 [Styela clava]
MKMFIRLCLIVALLESQQLCIQAQNGVISNTDMLESNRTQTTSTTYVTTTFASKNIKSTKKTITGQNKLANSTNKPISVTSTRTKNSTRHKFQNSTEAIYVFERWHCYDTHKPNSSALDRCCRAEMRRYESRWSNGGYYLTTILDRLQRWGCYQFEYECKEPTWNFSEYTSLIYDRFCNHTVLEEKCVKTVQQVVQSYGFIKPLPRKNKITEARWLVLAESLTSSEMHLRDLVKPCIQVALFDKKDGGVGRFHEIVEAYFPFCGIQWNGYDYDTAMYRDVSPWTGASLWCRGTMTIFLVMMAIVGFTTLIANIVILGVFAVTPKLRNSQSIYKISLAIADLCVGLVIWPNMIAMQYLTFFAPRQMGRIVPHPSTAENDTWVAHFPFGNNSLVHRFPGGTFGQRFPRPYIVFTGFFTILVLFVSIYTLMWGSFDRFWAVFRPLRYNKHNAKRQAKIACAALWGVSIFLAVLPTFIKQIQYNVISSLFIASSGLTSLVLLFFGLLLPLVITWIVTIFTFETSKKHARNRERIVSSSSNSDALERRLARTLSLMVLVFTICILPAMACIIAGFILPQTAMNDPKDLNVPVERAYTSAEYISVILLTSNSLWNCFIYSLRTRGFREASKKLYEDFLEKTKLGYVRRGALYVIQGARRVSLSSLYQMRKMSNVSTSDLRKKSVTSLSTNITKISETGSSGPRPSVDMTSTSVYIGSSTNSNAYSAQYKKKDNKGGRKQSSAGIVELRVERKKQQKEEDNEAYVGDDSTFGSFAIDTGADRFFHSVMENVEEQVEEEENAEKKT